MEEIIKKFIRFPLEPSEDPYKTGYKFCGQDEETIIIQGEGWYKNFQIEISPPYKCPSSFALNNGDFSKSYSASLIYSYEGVTMEIARKTGVTKSEAIRFIPCGFTKRCIWFHIYGKESEDCGNLWCDECTIRPIRGD